MDLGLGYGHNKLDWFIISINMSKEDVWISDFEIKKFIENSSNVDLKANFAGVFESNAIHYFVNFHHLMWKKRHAISVNNLQYRWTK